MNCLKRIAVAGVVVAGLAGVLRGQVAMPAQAANIYDDNAHPHADIANALRKARLQHKRVLVDFGGNWCGDCQVLDAYLRQPENAAILGRYYLVVHVSVGHIDKNLDIAEGYGIPIHRGVPAAAVLDARGKVVYATRANEYEHLARGESGALTEFLNRWKA